MKQKTKTATGILLAFAGGVFWGISGNCGDLLTKASLSSSWITSWRMILSGLLLLIPHFCLNKGESFALFREKKSLLRLIAYAYLGLAFSMFTYVEAMRYTDAGTVTVLQYVGPVMVLAVVCLKEKRLPCLREWLASLLALAGVFLIATGGDIRSMRLSPLGIFWGLMSAVGLVFYTLLPVGTDRRQLFGLLGFGLLLGGLTMLIGTGSWKLAVTVDRNVVLGLGGMILLGTVIAYAAYNAGVSLAGSVRASIVATVEPFSAIFFSALWFGTEFGLPEILAACLMCIAVILLSLENKKGKTENEKYTES